MLYVWFMLHDFCEKLHVSIRRIFMFVGTVPWHLIDIWLRTRASPGFEAHVVCARVPFVVLELCQLSLLKVSFHTLQVCERYTHVWCTAKCVLVEQHAFACQGFSVRLQLLLAAANRLEQRSISSACTVQSYTMCHTVSNIMSLLVAPRGFPPWELKGFRGVQGEASAA